MTVAAQTRLLLAGVLAAAALLPPPSTALAGSFTITPLRAELSARARTAALTVRNEDASAVVVQATAVLWEQAEGTDALTQSQDLIVSPAVFTLEPGASQLLRVALRRNADPERELSYRLLLEEVPTQAATGGNGLTVALRLSLPVFVAPIAAADPRLDWQATRSADGTLVVEATNNGNVHVQVREIVLNDSGAALLRNAAAGYVLPGAKRSWNFEAAATTPRQGTRLQATTDQGNFSTDLPIAGP
jgi:fimbrial chaperone protein